MANYVPFEKLQVNKSYVIYSSYWDESSKVVITELNPETGLGQAYHPEIESKSTFMFGVDDGFHNNLFWDDIPTREEIRNQRENGKKYVPPRKINGKYYDGGPIIYGELKELIDEFIANINKTFKEDTRFKMDKRNQKHYFLWESKLDFIRPSELLIPNNGKCDWSIIRYIEKNADVDIHSAERDSFGWLTGAIDKEYASGIVKTILYD